MLSSISKDDRPFVLSTPRLESNDRLNLRVPFDDPRVEELFRLKTSPRHWKDIDDMFSLPAEQKTLITIVLYG